MDEVTWLALTVVLSVLGAVATWLAFTRRGLSAGLLGVAVTLLVPAAYLTRTLRMLTRIAGAVLDWATTLVFSPSVWIGVALAGLSVVLFGASRALAAREVGVRRQPDARREAGPAAPAKGLGRPPASARSQPVVDDDLAEIEALLRKRGIS